MILQLNPKYQIGQKFQEKLHSIVGYLDNIIYERELFVSNIKSEYNFKKNEIQYIYELSFIYEDFEHIYRIVDEETLVNGFKNKV